MGPRVTSEEAGRFETAAKFGIEFNKRARDAQPGRSGLTGNAAAIGQQQHIELVGYFGGEQRLAHDGAGRLAGEIVVKRPAIYGNLAFAVAQKNTDGGRFAAPRPQILN